MRILRSVAAWIALALLLFGPVIVGVLVGPGPPFWLSLGLWFVVFTVVPSVADARAGRVARRGYGRYDDLSDLPWQGGDGGG